MRASPTLRVDEVQIGGPLECRLTFHLVSPLYPTTVVSNAGDKRATEADRTHDGSGAEGEVVLRAQRRLDERKSLRRQELHGGGGKS